MHATPRRSTLTMLLCATSFLLTIDRASAQVTPRAFTEITRNAESSFGSAVKQPVTEEQVTTGITDVFTITCWVKVLPVKGLRRTILSLGSDQVPGGYLRVDLAKGTGELQFFSPVFPGNLSAGVVFDDNRWHQLGITYARGRMKFYKDGDLVMTSPASGSLSLKTGSLVIGADAGKNFPLNGLVSRVKISNSVFNSLKMRDLFLGKLAQWDLDEGMGISTFQDHGNTLYGMLEGPVNTYDNYGVASTGWLKHAAWTSDPTFGSVVDFRTAQSSVIIDSSDINLGDRFTLAAWLKLPRIPNGKHVIVARGNDKKSPAYFEWRFDGANRTLQFYSPALSGSTGASLVITDTSWHHVAVSYTSGKMSFYKDGILLKSAVVKGSVADGRGVMSIGSGVSQENNFSGLISHLRIFGTGLSSAQVSDLFYEQPVGAWSMNEGSGDLVRSADVALDGTLSKAVWLPGRGSSFSTVLGFQDKDAYVATQRSIDLAGRFTIAAWIKIPAERDRSGAIVSGGKPAAAGYYELGLDLKRNITINAAGLTGDLQSGINIGDTNWHHVMITCGDGLIKFYKDRQLVKSGRVKGSVMKGAGQLTIGNTATGGNGFQGCIADLRIYKSVRIPEEVTHVVPPSGPSLILKRGIVFDRIQNQGFPLKEEWEIAPNDIVVAKGIGFDHIKVLFTADEFVIDSGLNNANMGHVDKVVNMALASGLPCVVCLHPEGKFKARFVGTDTGQVKMMGFYRAFAGYLAERWTPSQVAFQLMTEPFGNKTDGDWNRINDEMVAAVRSRMPDHTLIVSGDRAGNIYAMTAMKPLPDKNIYYSFTSYEPYRFGFSTMFGGWRGSSGFYKDLSYMPWPVSPGIIASRMSDMLSTVKDADQAVAREHLAEYGKTNFNAQWLKLRARNVREWNEAYGGDIPVIVAEFGALDPVQSSKMGASRGVYPEERVRFVGDLRRSFEAEGIGWEYWSFNEYFTVLDPVLRKPYGKASMEVVDKALVKELGLELHAR